MSFDYALDASTNLFLGNSTDILGLQSEANNEVMSMLSVLERALERAIIRHPLIKTVVETDAAMFGITGAISRLERLVPIIQIRESPVAREAMLVRRLVAKEWSNDYAPRISKSIQAKFPRAEPTLLAQLILSILYRRCRLIYHLSKSDKPQYEKGTENAAPSARRSRQQDMADDKFSYPPSYPDPPEVAHGEGKSKCPYCLNTVIPQSENREQWRTQWESHLKADLQPYVCLSAECRHFFMFFSTVEEWKDHMQSHGADWIRNIHRTRWPCPFCNDSTTRFLTQDELEDHLIHDEAPNHPHPMDWDTLTLERSMKPDPRNKYCCPLCNEEQKDGTPSERSNQLYSHFLAHLEVLALVSIDDWVVKTSKTIDASIDRTDSVDVGGRNPLHCRSGSNHDQGKSTKRKILAYPKRVWNKS
ncbi:hypothetical protein H634G_05509 [Metarhizium anisopliae BRIP 53293]|uniref:C2H2-type domain-containing protein n=1 Tax=Metarhizium anisopliae BRIP 53293 TaxID=1291518 RepID=A0A0D9NZ26_METAN|nr:hypothetical protein H634G_05509 [Metarhizium anisopliae BRIP 53293]